MSHYEGVAEETYSEIAVHDGDGNLIYLSEALPGKPSSLAVWRIRKFAYDVNGNLEGVTWAEGSRTFKYVANDYLTYTYS